MGWWVQSTPVVCRELDVYPTFTDTFISCPSIVYTIFSSLNVALVMFQLAVFFHLMYVAYVERKKEVPYLVSLAPICSIISVIELFNLSTVSLLSAFRYVYLVFCILQFYQYISAYYGDWAVIMRVLPGFSIELDVCCCCCKYRREVSVTRKSLIINKTLIYTGVITYMVMIMITVAFIVPEVVEDLLLGIGVVLFVVAIRCMKRFLTITRQFYPELSTSLRRKWTAVRICFLVVGLQGFALKVLESIGAIPPVDLFNSKVMVDVVHNMLVPGELCFGIILAHRAFSAVEPSTVESAPLLPKANSKGNVGSQTDDLRNLAENTLVRCDSGVHSPEPEYTPGYGSLNSEMMRHVDDAIQDNWRRSHPDLYQDISRDFVTSRDRIMKSRNFVTSRDVVTTSLSSDQVTSGIRSHSLADDYLVPVTHSYYFERQPNYAKGERCIQIL